MPFVLFILVLQGASVLPAGGIGIVTPGRALPTRDSRIARNRVEVAAQRGTSAKQSAISRSVFAKVSDYVYTLAFDKPSCKISSMVKIWNDGYAAAQPPPSQ